MKDYLKIALDKGYTEAVLQLESDMLQLFPDLTHSEIANKLKMKRSTVASKMGKFGFSDAKERREMENQAEINRTKAAKNPYYSNSR